MSISVLGPSLALALGLMAGSPAAPAHVRAPGTPVQAPGIEVIKGRLRVLAGEAWLDLAPGATLPQPLAQTSLRLGADCVARLWVPGAGVRLHGPLEVEYHSAQLWALRLQGSGRVQFEARTVRMQIELPGAAWVELGNGAAWIEGLPEGGWRVGSDAGEQLLLRPPPGVRWGGAATLAPGAVLRVLPAHVVPPPSTLRSQAREPRAWSSFSWPWNAPTLPAGGGAWVGIARAGVHAASRALAALSTARVLGY